jgi:hypothetical protein
LGDFLSTYWAVVYFSSAFRKLVHSIGLLLFAVKNIYLPILTKHGLGYILGDSITNSSAHPLTDVMIFKIFSPKNLAKRLAFFAQTTASFCQKL